MASFGCFRAFGVYLDVLDLGEMCGYSGDLAVFRHFLGLRSSFHQDFSRKKC